MASIRAKIKLKYVLILVAALILLGNRGFRNLLNNYREYRTLMSRKAELETQRSDLAKRLKETNAQPAVEQAARSELGLIKPGETVYRFPPPKESDK
ncbi:MAG TPA: hypothetical protein DCZ92_09955 [Elusimicrobia bacterium]|nr:MAG: hypothetical protein A2016_07280 [Elusimicrobia bacterium GWF2_62_30]HBA61124.1 hypothetical protein [Elusimicrobiota bacterium]